MSGAAEKTIRLDGHSLALSSLDKVMFPEDGITKGDVVDYYARIAETAVPHYRDRPLTMQRFPDGIDAKGFFQKNMPEHFPAWMARVTLAKEGGEITHVIANDAAALVYLANQACLTPHLALSRRDRPGHPDRLIFDLDPSDDDFSKVQFAARTLRAGLDALDLPSFVQTTGSRGLHIVVPLDREAGFDRVRAFARRLAESLARRHPDRLTTAQRKADRGDRVFIDYLRNAYGQTAVAPYALRARPGAPVATPLRWEEALAGGLGPRTYTLGNIFRRLAQTDDPWKPMARRATGLKGAEERLASGN